MLNKSKLISRTVKKYLSFYVWVRRLCCMCLCLLFMAWNFISVSRRVFTLRALENRWLVVWCIVKVSNFKGAQLYRQQLLVKPIVTEATVGHISTCSFHQINGFKSKIISQIRFDRVTGELIKPFAIYTYILSLTWCAFNIITFHLWIVHKSKF